MTLSNNQKLRLEQLEIPRWVKKSLVQEELTEESTENNEVIAEGKLLLSRGDNPSIFWLLKDATSLPLESFINDVSISIKQPATDWQVLCGDISQLQHKINRDYQNALFIILSDVITSVDIQTEKNITTITLPAETTLNLSLKRQLWNIIKKAFHE